MRVGISTGAFLVLLLTLQGCAPTLPDWHINDPANMLPAEYFPDGVAPSSEDIAIEVYFGDRELDPIEGLWIWGDSSFLVAVIRNDTGLYSAYDYLGVVVKPNPAHAYRWRAGQVNLLLIASADPRTYTGANFNPMHDLTNTPFVLDGPDVMRMRVYDRSAYQDVNTLLVRQYPNRRQAAIPSIGEDIPNGTCFFVSPNGVAVTNHHVVEDARSVELVLADGRKLPAEVTRQSPTSDVAVLSVETETPDYLSLAADGSAQIGDEIFTIGFPEGHVLGTEPKFTEGSISSLSGFQGDASRMQISAPIQRGNSGGALVSFSGEVVGVVVSSASTGDFYRATGEMLQNVNYAVKSEFVRPMLDEAPPVPPARSRGEAISRVQKAVCQVVASF